MIQKTVKIHDKFQFEIKLGYEIKKEREKTSYDIETYFFIPNNLDINRYTYSKKIFYKDIHGYIRLKTPTLLLRQIAGSKSSPIPVLRDGIETLLTRRDRESHENFESHVKMICSIVKSALRDHVSFTANNMPPDIPALINEFVTESTKVVEAYRDLKPVITVPTVPDKVLSIYRFGDEFLSHNIEIYGFRLLKRIDRMRSADMAALREKLVTFIKSEYDYRIACNYQSPLDEEKDKEILIYRQGVLKKYIGSVLFLDTRRESEGKFLEHLLFGIAAGLSMVFATLVAFIAHNQYGNFTFPVFVALVVSYIFKDRIKEFARLYFINKASKFRFDQKTSIYADDGPEIGICKEAVNFIKESELPNRIKSIRKRAAIADVDNQWRGEKVIYYRKRVTLFSKRMKKVYKEYNIEGVNDIIRFNIGRFLEKMDNPSRTIYTLKGDTVCEVPGDRVYYVNLIIKISRGEKTFFKRARLVLNRDGIKRIEEIDAS